MCKKDKAILAKVLPKMEKSILTDRIFALIEKTEAQEQVIEKLSKQVQEQAGTISRLEQELASALRAPYRQNAPFRQDEEKKKSSRKASGRRKGHRGSYRTPSGKINEKIVAPLKGCPQCEGVLKHLRPIKQIIEEIPPIELRIVELTTYRGYCECCEQEVHSTHPLQVSHATGAASVQLGPRATAMTLRLHHKYGLTVRKVSDLLADFFHLPLSPGGVSHLEHRMANKLLPNYQQLWQQARQAEVLQGDETGWYIGNPGHYLFVLTNPNLTIYDFKSTRSRDTIEQMLGDDFDGIFVSDCLNMYDFVSPIQQKCYSHHLNAVKKAQRILPQSGYLQQVKSLLKDAIELKKKLKVLEPPEYQRLCEQLEQKANQLFPTIQNDNGFLEFDHSQFEQELKPAEQMVANRIARRRSHLFTFLYHENVPATNNLSERQLRPAVIQRKLSCGNKTDKGARTFKIIRSVFVSDNQNEKNFEVSVFNAIKQDLVTR